jgi:hypothetical protein
MQCRSVDDYFYYERGPVAQAECDFGFHLTEAAHAKNSI